MGGPRPGPTGPRPKNGTDYQLDTLGDSEIIVDDISIVLGSLRNSTSSDNNQNETDVDSLMFGLETRGTI